MAEKGNKIMCFTTYQVKTEPEVAKNNILVFKVLYSDNRSLIFGFKYEPFKTYRLRKKLKYKALPSLDRVNKFTKYLVINKGFHSYSLHKFNGDRLRAQLSGIYGSSIKQCAFIIPRGAKYYYDSITNEYVSTSIQSLDLKSII